MQCSSSRKGKGVGRPWPFAAQIGAALLVLTLTTGLDIAADRALAGVGSQFSSGGSVRVSALPGASDFSAAASSIARIAQAQPLLTVEPGLVLRPGGSVALPARLATTAGQAGFNVVVRQVPGGVTISEAENVGSGVWLVRSGKLAQANIVAAPNAPAGAYQLGVALVSATGEIVLENRLALTVGSATATAQSPNVKFTTAEPKLAPEPKQRVAQAGKTWEQLLDKGGGAPSPQPSGRAASKSAPQKGEAQLLAYARHLVRECTTCHSLYGQDVGIPLMIGLSRDRFTETMDNYRTGKRDNQAMGDIARSLTNEETTALAIYLGRIRPPAPEEIASPRAAPAAPSPEIAAAKRSEPGAEERVGRWVARGRQLLEAGDIAQARLFFQRATEYGNAQAAVLMANSFDPNVLAWRPGMGLEAEPLKARQWYQLAAKLGAGTDAEKRLADLPTPR